MSNKINYTDAPDDINRSLESAIIVEDLLPAPSELVRKSEKE